MKIVYFCSSRLPNPKSHSMQVVQTAAAMARAGARVELVATRLRGTAEEVLEHYGLEPHPNLCLRMLARRGSSRNRWSGRGFRCWIRAYLAWRMATGSVDAVYVRGAATALRLIETIAPVCRLFGRPLVYEVHAIQHLDLRRQHAGRYGEGEELERNIEKRRQLEQRAYRGLTEAVCISTRLRDLLSEQFGLSLRTLIAPSGVHPPAAPPPPLKDREYDVAYVGSLYDFNGVDLLIEALGRLPRARGVIVGGGREGELERLRAMIADRGLEDRVRLTGRVTPMEAAEWMRRARALVAPLRPSGQIDRISWCSPAKIFEYMAAGGAIVAARLKNLADVLEEGRSARLFEPGDAAALAGTLGELLENPDGAQRLADAALAESQRYTFEARARAILAFLRHDDSGNSQA